MIEGCSDIETLMSTELHRFLDEEAREAQTVVTEPGPAMMVQAALKMNISGKSAKGRIKLLFMEYCSLLRINSLSESMKRHPKLPSIMSFR